LKKSIIVFGMLLSLSSILVGAETLPTGELVLPDNFLTNALQPILQKISLLVGGIFGVYVILALMQVFRERKKVKLLQDIRNDLDLLTKHFGVKHSHERKSLFRKILSIFHFDSEENKKTKK